jgi:hypothetical protein
MDALVEFGTSSICSSVAGLTTGREIDSPVVGGMSGLQQTILA